MQVQVQVQVQVRPPDVVLEGTHGLLLDHGQQLVVLSEQRVVEEHLLALVPGGLVVHLVVAVVVW